MLYIASDHAGFELKEFLKRSLEKRGIRCKDFGALIYDREDDYPDFIIPLAKAVGKNPTHNRGIILGGSGQGEQIAANKIRGVRAALYYGGPTDIIKLSKTHNNTNILSLGARFLSKREALRAVDTWFAASFENVARHKRRIRKIDDLTKQ